MHWVPELNHRTSLRLCLLAHTVQSGIVEILFGDPVRRRSHTVANTGIAPTGENYRISLRFLQLFQIRRSQRPSCPT
jgi:hypothetical protein